VRVAYEARRAARWVHSAALRIPAAAAAFAAYLAFALFNTWPWVTDPGGTLFGVIGGDLTSGVAGFQQAVDEGRPPFLPGTIDSLNAPEGVPVDWPLHLASIGSSTTLWVLSAAIGSIAAHGVVAVLGFVLSAFAMFLLARSVTGSGGAAFVAGLAFGFWPYMYGTGWTWPHYIHLWVLVLLVWRMLVVAEKPTIRNGVLAGGAAVLAMTWIQYNLLIAGVAYGTLAGVAIARSALTAQLSRQIRAQAAAAGVVGLAVVGLFAAVAAGGSGGIPDRTAQQAVQGSARLEMYVVPGPRQPLVGDRTGPWLFKRFTGPVSNPPPDRAIYADIYLGVSLLLLAFAGAAWTALELVRRRRNALTVRSVAAGLTAFVLGVVALAFSGPPRVKLAGLVIPLPYAVVEQVTTVFRVPHRFAVIVMLAACLLAALGLRAIIHPRGPATRVAILVAVAAVVAVDLRAEPSPATTKIEHPRIYQLLRRQPPGIVAEYPLNPASTVDSVEALFQEVHAHPLFGGARPGSEDESRKQELQFLLARRTVPDLAGYGVSYVLVHHPDPRQPPRPGQPIPGLELIGGDAAATLYRVTARPSRFTAFGTHGLYLTEAPAPGWRWVGQDGAELELQARCRPCVGTVSFPVISFAGPRVLTIKDDHGRTLFSHPIEPTHQRVRFHVRFPAEARLRLSTQPPPVAINSVIPGPDARAVSISIGQPVVFEPDTKRGHRWVADEGPRPPG
jgi:hypothetical protein